VALQPISNVCTRVCLKSFACRCADYRHRHHHHHHHHRYTKLTELKTPTHTLQLTLQLHSSTATAGILESLRGMARRVTPVGKWRRLHRTHTQTPPRLRHTPDTQVRPADVLKRASARAPFFLWIALLCCGQQHYCSDRSVRAGIQYKAGLNVLAHFQKREGAAQLISPTHLAHSFIMHNIYSF
jgi:hypothetical protein